MGAAVIIMLILAVAVVGYGTIVYQPVVRDLAFESDFWNGTDVTVDPQLLAQRNVLYNTSLAVPIIIGIGVVAVWGYLAVTRRDFD